MRSFYGIRENLFIDLLLLEYGGPMTLSRLPVSRFWSKFGYQDLSVILNLTHVPGRKLVRRLYHNVIPKTFLSFSNHFTRSWKVSDHNYGLLTVQLIFAPCRAKATDGILPSHLGPKMIPSRNDPQPCKDINPVTIPAPEYSVALKWSSNWPQNDSQPWNATNQNFPLSH